MPNPSIQLFKGFPATSLRDVEQLLTQSQPMWHPLGFVSATLKRDHFGTLKLHYWPSIERRCKTPDWRIHDHAFRIVSKVIVGDVGSAAYRTMPGSSHRLYNVKYDGKDSTLEATDQLIDCLEESRVVRGAGAEYEIPLGQFHQNIVLEGTEAMTLVLKSEQSSQLPRVVGTPSIPSIPFYRRSPFPVDTILGRLRKFMR